MSTQCVVFKGTATGLILVLDPEAGIDKILEAMEQKMIAAERFFRGAILDVTYRGRELDREQEEAIFHLLNTQSGARIRKLEREPASFREPAEKKRTAGRGNRSAAAVPPILTEPAAEGLANSLPPAGRTGKPIAGNTYFYRGTLRSGQKIEQDGHVVILGDVNPGAEVLAEGHILVMGTIRGLVHAGSRGDRDATITAIRLQPMQIRIADTITRPPDQGEADLFMAYEVARIRGDTIVIEGSSR